MTFRCLVAITTLLALATSSAPVRAAEQAPDRSSAVRATHAVTSVALHHAVQEAHSEGAATRTSLTTYLARPDVRDQITGVGLAPDEVAARLAELSDVELARLQQQLMSDELKSTTAGLSAGATIVLVVAIVATAALLVHGIPNWP